MSMLPGQRILTTKFKTNNIRLDRNKYVNRNERGLYSVIDIGEFDLEKIFGLIKLGNKLDLTDAEIGEILDTYIASDGGHSIIDAYFQLLRELDNDIHIFKDTGITVDDLVEQMKSNTNNTESKIIEMPINTEE